MKFLKKKPYTSHNIWVEWKNKNYRGDVQVYEGIPLQYGRLKKVKRHNKPKKKKKHVEEKTTKHKGESELQNVETLLRIHYMRNTELAIHALDQVHCWDAYFRLRIGHFENFTPLNFQPLLFSKQWRLVDRRCTLEPLVAKKIMYKVP
jgi:hypothetical protein